jgi:exodeoxyribonuclease VII small subunit
MSEQEQSMSHPGPPTDPLESSVESSTGSSAVPPVGAPPVSYAAACEELDALLEGLEDGRADIDALTEQVGRARYLLAFCDERLRGTRLRVADVLDELDPP